MNPNKGHGLPLEVAICMNYLEAQGAKTYDGARLLLVARFRLGLSTSRHFQSQLHCHRVYSLCISLRFLDFEQ
jgi:hypothetical protein